MYAVSSVLQVTGHVYCIAVSGTNSASELWGVIHHISSHSIATQHNWTYPALTPDEQVVLDLPTPEGWKAELP